MDGQLITFFIVLATLCIGFIVGRSTAPSRRDILRSILLGADMQARRDNNLPPPSPESIDRAAAPAFSARSAAKDFVPSVKQDASDEAQQRRRVGS